MSLASATKAISATAPVRTIEASPTRRGVGERAHLRHQLVHQIVGEDHAREQIVPLLEDVRRVVHHRQSQRRLQPRGIEREELEIGLAVVLDEIAQRRDRTVAAQTTPSAPVVRSGDSSRAGQTTVKP